MDTDIPESDLQQLPESDLQQLPESDLQQLPESNLQHIPENNSVQKLVVNEIRGLFKEWLSSLFFLFWIVTIKTD